MRASPLYRETCGSGPDLCLLHGWGTHGGIWAPWVASLAGHYRVHVIDLPGHGESDVGGGFGLQQAVARVQVTLDDAGVTKASICGWSLGGLVAMALALDSPARVRRLVLLATTPRFVNGDDWQWGVDEEVLTDFARQLMLHGEDTIQRFLALQAQGDSQARDIIRQLRKALNSRGHPDTEALAQALEVLRGTDLRAHLPVLERPVLWVGGQRDVLVRPAAIEWAAARCPQGRALIVPRAGHAPFLSHAAQVLSAVDEFFAHA